MTQPQAAHANRHHTYGIGCAKGGGEAEGQPFVDGDGRDLGHQGTDRLGIAGELPHM